MVGVAANGVEAIAEGGAIEIELANASGALSGVVVRNNDVRDTEIIATGAISGNDGNGIDVTNGTATNGVSIDTVDVRGSENGIQVRHDGTGQVVVRSAGTVRG